MTEELFLNYGKQTVDDDDIQAVVKVLKGDWLTQGPNVVDFEQAICEYTGAKYCVAVANGTAALHLATLALDLKKGSEGITSPNTFVASANCLVYAGLKPDFADIRPDTYNIDFDQIKKRVTANTKVIVAVDFAGQVADLEQIYPWAQKKGIKVIEDAAHSIGSKYADGSRVGNCRYSDLTTFSFHPVKTITTGEGGAITTNDEKLYRRLQMLRTHGITKNDMSQNPGPWYYEMQDLGFNYRLTDIQAVLGTSQMKKLDGFVIRRREIVAMYNNAFKGLDNCQIPFESPGLESSFHLYVLKIDYKKVGLTRSEVMTKLKERGIGTQVHYIPVHTQLYYQQNFGFKEGDFPISEEYYQHAISLPLYPKMTDEDVQRVIEAITALLKT